MLKRSFLMGAVLFGISLLCAGGAKADTIGTLSLTGCGGGDTGCPDATYSFNITPTTATLSIQIDGTVGAANTIEGVNLGFTSSSNISGLSVVGPSGVTWSTGTGSLNNNGCGSNNGSFLCADAISPVSGIAISQGQTYTWEWTYDPLDPSLIATTGSVHVGANYDPPNGLIVSQTGATSVPEPGTMTLLFAGLLGLGLAGTARRRQFVCS